MTVFRTATAALLFSTAMTPAFADLSADDVWTQMNTMLTMDKNADVTFSGPTRDGDSLRIEGLTVVTKNEVQSDLSDDVMMQTMTYGNVVMTENGDGTVSIALPDPLMVEMGLEGEEPVKFKMTLDGFDTTVREDGDKVIYDSSIDTFTGTLLDVPGDEVETKLPHDWVTVSDVASVYEVTEGENWSFVSSLKSGAIAVAGSFTAEDDGEPTAVSLDIKMAGSNGEASAVMPAEMDYNDPKAMFASDFAVKGNFAVTGTNADIMVTDASGETKIATSSDASLFNFGFGKEQGFAFDLSDNGTKATIESAAMPFPVDFSSDTVGYSFQMPLVKSDAAPAKFGLDFVNLSINDAIWNLFDPGENLPRGPVTLRVGASGMIKLLANLVDDDAMENMDENPFVPLSAKIDRLQLTGVGIDVNGEGSVEFDEDDMFSYPGMPAPIGDVTLTASGSNGLIDNLIKMGLIPEDQAMMTRMMIGMFAESTGDDSIRSHIEFKSGGGVYANGQKLR